MCKKRGITTAYQLQRKAEILSPTVAISLFNETYTRISDATLDKLCRALDCQPGDLMIYVPSKPTRD